MLNFEKEREIKEDTGSTSLNTKIGSDDIFGGGVCSEVSRRVFPNEKSKREGYI